MRGLFPIADKKQTDQPTRIPVYAQTRPFPREKPETINNCRQLLSVTARVSRDRPHDNSRQQATDASTAVFTALIYY